MIRLAKKEDAKDIISLLEEVLLVHNKIRPDLYKEAGSKYNEEELNKIIADERYLIYVCEEDEKVVGHCIVIKEEKKETNSTLPYKSLYIDDLCVKEKYRNKGIATSLYNIVKEYAINDFISYEDDGNNEKFTTYYLETKDNKKAVVYDY